MTSSESFKTMIVNSIFEWSHTSIPAFRFSTKVLDNWARISAIIVFVDLFPLSYFRFMIDIFLNSDKHRMRKWSGLMLKELCFPGLKVLNCSHERFKLTVTPIGPTTLIWHIEYGWRFTIVRAFVAFGVMLNDCTWHHRLKNVFELSVFSIVKRSGRVDFELIRVFVPVQREKTRLILHASQFTLIYKRVKLTGWHFWLLEFQIKWLRR